MKTRLDRPDHLVHQAKLWALPQGCTLKDLVAAFMFLGLHGDPATDLATALQLDATPASPALFCRTTPQGVRRLVSTPAIFTACRSVAMTDRDAVTSLSGFQALPQVDLIDEPAGLEALRWRLAGLQEAAPKRWMDEAGHGG